MRVITTLCLLLAVISVNAQFTVSTYAGNGTAGLVNGPISSARFNQPSGICRDKKGNIYIADGGNNCIRKIDASGNVSVYAGSKIAGLVNAKDTLARFNDPFCCCVDDAGNLYVSDFNNQCIRKIDIAGNVTTLAGSGTEGYKNGPDSLAEFDYPRGIAVDKAGNLYVADSWNHRIRMIDGITHYVSTYAGGGSSMGVGTAGGLADDTASAARFYTPSGVAISSNGTLYVADAYNHRIRMIDTLRNVTTVAGSGNTGPNNGGFADSTAGNSLLNTPTDLCCTTSGNILIGDTYNNRVRLLTPDGRVSTVAGNGTAGLQNGDGKQAEFNYTRGLVANATADSIWVIDANNNAVRLIIADNAGIATAQAFTTAVFPNPANNRLQVQLPGNGAPSAVYITDCLGRIRLEKTNVNTLSATIDISILPSGMYFVALIQGINRSTIKFVKQ